MTISISPEANEIANTLRQSAHPFALQAAQYIEELYVLLTEALDSVDADEQARLESWPEEVACGDLVLDLGNRIRGALGNFDMNRT